MIRTETLGFPILELLVSNLDSLRWAGQHFRIAPISKRATQFYELGPEILTRYLEQPLPIHSKKILYFFANFAAIFNVRK